MIDLDDFKLYNDIYGHDMGDQVLCIVADVIKNCIRKTDKLIRYGGDEFLLILSDMVRGTCVENCFRFKRLLRMQRFQTALD